MDEAIQFVKNTIAANLHRYDESFNSSGSGDLGDELVRWERSGRTPRHHPGEEAMWEGPCARTTAPRGWHTAQGASPGLSGLPAPTGR